MYAHGTCQLCYSCYRHLYLLSRRHDKVSELIDDDDDVRHESMAFLRVEVMVEELFVIFLYVPDTSVLKHVVALVHKHTETLQRLHHFLYVGDDRLFLVLLQCCHEMTGNR